MLAHTLLYAYIATFLEDLGLGGSTGLILLLLLPVLAVVLHARRAGFPARRPVADAGAGSDVLDDGAGP